LEAGWVVQLKVELAVLAGIGSELHIRTDVGLVLVEGDGEDLSVVRELGGNGAYWATRTIVLDVLDVDTRWVWVSV